MFKKAQRKQAKLKIGLSGPSGSGKTYSALLLAKGLGGKIAVIDTENNSASLYADQFDFDFVCLTAPFTTDKYLEALKAASQGGYNIVIVDSATHQWMGDGGLYERKTMIDSRGGNSFTNWSKFTPEHNKFLSAIVQHDTHLLLTVRSKQEYALTQNDKGKAVPQKVGLAPVQREGFEYELTAMLDLAMNHSAQASKDRTGLFDGKTFIPSEEDGKNLVRWLAGSAEVPSVDKMREIKKVIELQKEAGLSTDELKDTIIKQFGVASFKDLEVDQLKQLAENLKKNKPTGTANVTQQLDSCETFK